MELEVLHEGLRRLARAIESRDGPTWGLSQLHRRAGVRRLRADIRNCLRAIDELGRGPEDEGAEDVRRIA